MTEQAGSAAADKEREVRAIPEPQVAALRVLPIKDIVPPIWFRPTGA